MLDDRTEAVLRRLEREYLEAVERGFLGPREGARLRERHIDDALVSRLSDHRCPASNGLTSGRGPVSPDCLWQWPFPRVGSRSSTLIDAAWTGSHRPQPRSIWRT